MEPTKPSKFDAAILALACGASVDNAAQQAGVNKRTLYRRLKRPDFSNRVQALRTDMVQRLAGSLTAAGTESLKTLLDLLKVGTAPSVRLGAAGHPGAERQIP